MSGLSLQIGLAVDYGCGRLESLYLALLLPVGHAQSDPRASGQPGDSQDVYKLWIKTSCREAATAGNQALARVPG